MTPEELAVEVRRINRWRELMISSFSSVLEIPSLGQPLTDLGLIGETGLATPLGLEVLEILERRFGKPSSKVA